MKNLFKFAFVVLALCFAVFLTSCGEYGGTIVVKNNYSMEVYVDVYSDFSVSGSVFRYKNKYGPQKISAGGTGSFSVTSDAKYGIVWFVPSGDKYKTVNVSKGETVEVTIP